MRLWEGIEVDVERKQENATFTLQPKPDKVCIMGCLSNLFKIHNRIYPPGLSGSSKHDANNCLLYRKEMYRYGIRGVGTTSTLEGRGRVTRCLSVDTTLAVSSPASGAVS